MNHRTIILTICLLALFALLFSSCSIEKRHYRGGYYTSKIKNQENEYASTEKRPINDVSTQDHSISVKEEQIIYMHSPDTREEDECRDDSSTNHLQNEPVPNCEAQKFSHTDELLPFTINDTLKKARKIKIAGNRSDQAKSNTLVIVGLVLLATALIFFSSGWWFLHGPGLVIAAATLIISTIVFATAIMIKDRNQIHSYETSGENERRKMDSIWTRRGKLWFWIFTGLLVIASVGMMLYVIQSSLFMVLALITGLLTFSALIISLVTNRKKLGANNPAASKHFRRRRLMSIIEMVIAPLAVLLSIVIALLIGFS